MLHDGFIHAKTVDLQRILGLNKYEAVGILECIWHFAAVNACDGGIGRHSNGLIAYWIGYLGDADKLISGLVEAGFLDVCDESRLQVHDWFDHAPKYIKDRYRQRKARKSQVVTPVSHDVTPVSQPVTPESQPVELSKVKASKDKHRDITIENRDLSVLVEKWNKAPQVAKCRTLSAGRKEVIWNYINTDPNWFSDALEAIDKFPLNCWKNRSYKPNFDWFLREGTIIQILEDQHDWGDNYTPPPKPRKELTEAQKAEKAISDDLYSRLKEYQRKGEGLSDAASLLRDQIAQMENTTCNS